MVAPKRIDLSRANLEKQGIFYITRSQEDVRNDPYIDNEVLERACDYLTCTKSPMQFIDDAFLEPKLVAWMKEGLLDSTHIIPHYCGKFLDDNEHSTIPADATFFDEGYTFLSSAGKERAEDDFGRIIRGAREAARQARLNRAESVDEHTWQSFMEHHVFQHYQERHPPLFNGAMRDPVFDTYETCCNVLWNNAPDARSIINDLDNVLPHPKPDVAFGFQIMKPTNQDLKGFRRSSLVKNFSLHELRRLSARNVVCSPATDLAKYRPGSTVMENMPRNEFLCFPFAIAELKRANIEGRQQEFCFCQAANGASRALRIYEKLFAFADKHNYNHHVPPVVTFTCIGPTIRIWVAYSIKGPLRDTTAHIMTCIEELELTSTWAVLRIHVIIGNLLRWATRILRPNVSNQISRWRVHIANEDP